MCSLVSDALLPRAKALPDGSLSPFDLVSGHTASLRLGLDRSVAVASLRSNHTHLLRHAISTETSRLLTDDSQRFPYEKHVVSQPTRNDSSGAYGRTPDKTIPAALYGGPIATQAAGSDTKT